MKNMYNHAHQYNEMHLTFERNVAFTVASFLN